MSRFHVIGAGLAGLAAALSLSRVAGAEVVVHEAGLAAGGRCRSYFDKELGLRIDNGNHLLLSGNTEAVGFLQESGGLDHVRFEDAAIPFLDLTNGQRWVVRPNAGRLPWWILAAGRRVPGTRPLDYLQMARLARISDDTVVADAFDRGVLYKRLVEPLAIAALNTPPQEGLARLLGVVVRETLALGAAACRPVMPEHGWSEALVQPALATLAARGAAVHFNSRVVAMTITHGRITALRSTAGETAIGPQDAVVLAVPSWVAADILPGLVAPDAYQAILNIHFAQQVNAGPSLVGLIGGTAEWVFRKRDHLSVTISAANALVDEPAATIAERTWPDVVAALRLTPGAMSRFRVVKEKRATFAATAAQEARRSAAQTQFATNLAIAGDWTDTRLPATIEGAIRSGRTAARVLLRQSGHG
jgi:hydroxysqualene dehydroxylase